MPIRKIPKNYRNITGIAPHNKAVGAAAYESSLERDFLTLLAFNQDVQRFEVQPLAIEWFDTAGKRHVYTPDVLVHYQCDVIVYEVKYRSDLRENWQQLKPKFQAALRFCKQNGWRFKLITEVEIHTDFLRNARFLLRTWIGATDPTNPKQARQFVFRIDPRDLSVIWFFDPDLLMYFPIPYRDSSHPVISIWELREIQRQLKREQKQNIDENMIFAAYSRMRELEQQAKGKTKAIRRAEQRRQLDQHTQAALPIPKDDFQAAMLPETQNHEFDDIQPFDDLDDLS